MHSNIIVIESMISLNQPRFVQKVQGLAEKCKYPPSEMKMHSCILFVSYIVCIFEGWMHLVLFHPNKEWRWWGPCWNCNLNAFILVFNHAPFREAEKSEVVILNLQVVSLPRQVLQEDSPWKSRCWTHGGSSSRVSVGRRSRLLGLGQHSPTTPLNSTNLQHLSRKHHRVRITNQHFNNNIRYLIFWMLTWVKHVREGARAMWRR